jgi:hypothetical protein
MERKQALLGILAVVAVAVFCSSWSGAIPSALAQDTMESIGQLPSAPRDLGDRDPKYGHGPNYADPDWFGTNSYDRIPVVEVQPPQRRSTWVLLSPYGGLLDWLFRQASGPTVIAIRNFVL